MIKDYKRYITVCYSGNKLFCSSVFYSPQYDEDWIEIDYLLDIQIGDRVEIVDDLVYIINR